MDVIKVEGGAKLHGTVHVEGAKNSALKLMNDENRAITGQNGTAPKHRPISYPRLGCISPHSWV